MSDKYELSKVVLKSQIDWCDINIKQLSESVEYWENQKKELVSELLEL